jgi:hypothetical protein
MAQGIVARSMLAARCAEQADTVARSVELSASEGLVPRYFAEA